MGWGELVTCEHRGSGGLERIPSSNRASDRRFGANSPSADQVFSAYYVVLTLFTVSTSV